MDFSTPTAAFAKSCIRIQLKEAKQKTRAPSAWTPRTRTFLHHNPLPPQDRVNHTIGTNKVGEVALYYALFKDLRVNMKKMRTLCWKKSGRERFR